MFGLVRALKDLVIELRALNTQLRLSREQQTAMLDRPQTDPLKLVTEMLDRMRKG